MILIDYFFGEAVQMDQRLPVAFFVYFIKEESIFFLQEFAAVGLKLFQ